MKIVKKIQLKIVILTAMKNRYILHGRVFVMGPNNHTSCSNTPDVSLSIVHNINRPIINNPKIVN